MIALLAPLALLGLSLLGIPIILHLFKPRKVREIPFSSLRWLRDSTQRLSKRFQWHQILLFILRVVFIASIALAIARPIVARRGEGRFRDRVVILDQGRGMNYREPGRPTPFDIGRRIARDALGAGGPGDRVSLVLAGRPPVTAGPLAADGEAYAAELQQAAPGAAAGRVGAALDEVVRLIEPDREDALLEVLMITDFRQGGWSYADGAALRRRLGNRPLRLNVVDVGPAAPVNAWIAQARRIDQPDGRSMIRVTVGASGGDHETRRVRLLDVPGLGDLVEEVTIRAGSTAVVDLPLPMALDPDRHVARVQLEPPDAMPDDDVYWINLDRRTATRVLVIEPHRTVVETLQPGIHLRTAMAAIAETGQAVMQIEQRTPETVTIDDINAAHAVFLVDVPGVSPLIADAIDRHVRAGAGVALFLGPAVEPERYNRLWTDSAHQGLLPAPLGEQRRFDHGDRPLPRWRVLRPEHPLLKGLADPLVGELGHVAFRAAFDIDAETLAAARAAIVPVAIETLAPAIVVHAVGSGQLILFNTTADDTWSDLPRRPVFVPLVDRLLSFMTGGLLQGAHIVGHALTVPVPEGWEHVPLRITAPDGARLTPRRRVFGGRPALYLDATRQVGVYRMHPEDADPATEGVPVVVQADYADRLTHRMETDTLRGWWPDADVQVTRPDPVTGRYDRVTRRRSLVPWLIALAAACLVAEMFLVHWFCPRLGPRIIGPPADRMFS